MISGLSKDEFDFLYEKLIRPLKDRGATVFIFGSRAKGTHKKFSDIDILFSNASDKTIPSNELYEIVSFFEDSNFPYKIDLVNDTELASSYRASVDREKIEL
jgi:predicted nucleotidyltransferase